MRKLNDLDAKVLGAMSGSERIRLLLREAGYPTLTAFAHDIGFRQQEVSYCVTGEREYPAIREALADRLKLDVDEVVTIIMGEEAA